MFKASFPQIRTRGGRNHCTPSVRRKLQTSGSSCSTNATESSTSSCSSPIVTWQTQQDARVRHRNNTAAQQRAFGLHTNFAPDTSNEEAVVESGGARFSDRAIANFDGWDADSDGYLSEQEIAGAVNDGKNRGGNAAAAATLHNQRSKLEELSNDEWGDENDGVTRQDLEKYRALQDSTNDVAAETEEVYDDGQERIRKTSRELFVGEASANHLEQGKIGSCEMISSAASIASQDYFDRDANRLEDMIQDNGNGTYTVNFADGDPVTVDAPTDAEISRYATAGRNGLWMTVLEKAYGRTRGDAAVAGDGSAGGAYIGTAFKKLTGGSTKDHLESTDLNTTRAKLTRAFENGGTVNASIEGGIQGSDRKRGLPTDHAYAITGYDVATDMVTIRNPWGNTELVDATGAPRDGVDDGEFTMSLEEFNDTFSRTSYGAL